MVYFNSGVFMRQYSIVFVVFSSLFLMPSLTTAQTMTRDAYSFDNVIGLNFSTTTGSGLFYERRLGSDFRIKAVGYYYLSDNGQNSNTVLNTAIECQLDLFRVRMESYALRAYVCTSARYYREDNSSVDSYIVKGGMYIDTTVAQSNFLNSYNLGLGIEILIEKRFSFGLGLGYGFREERLFPDMYDPSHYPVREILPTIGIDFGVHF